MSTTLPAEPTTVRALLFGEEGENTAETLASCLHERGVAETLSRGTRGMAGSAGQAVEREVATVVDGFLAMDLIDLAGAGWRKHSSLRDAARRTRDAPESEELVALASHHVTSTHRPCLDLILDGAKVGTLDLAITIDFDLEGLLALIRRGRLVSLQGGRCTVTGTLAIAEKPVAQRSRRLDLPGMLQLRSGIPLLSAEELAPGGGAAAERTAEVTGFRMWLASRAGENEALGDLARADDDTLSGLLTAREQYWVEGHGR
ncbi:hypothetical protein [Streptomyces sp. NPDC048248]|uniref:hypothetical protein n=1 Tax=Streptomyces sp. NPDC048248 TaxID=3365523 RepID=UPI003722F08C